MSSSQGASLLRALRALEALANADPDAKIVDYGDSLLRASDVELLAQPVWLNDA